MRASNRAAHFSESVFRDNLGAEVRWDSREFAQALSDEKLPRRTKLQARSYKTSGAFPVIDQGQNEVAGWTDDHTLVIDSGLPYVVFGDHTRNFKYVNCPFVLGADGTQLLKPSNEFCASFFYFACLQLDLPSRGYNRHFTFLKEKSLPLPPKPEQEKIAAILWKLQRAIATQDQLIAATRDLKQSAMQRLFTHGLRGEALKDTEIGPMPKSWRIERCEDVTREITVGVVVRPASHYVESGVPAFRSMNVKEDFIDDRNLVYFGQEANDTILSKSKLAARDILIVRTGYPGTSSVVPEHYEGANCIDLVVVRPDLDLALPEYLSRFFNSHLGRSQTTASSYGLAQQHLNVGAVKRTLIGLPGLDEQREIATALASVDRKLTHHQRKRAALNDLFQTLLHKLMTAEIRVADLDIDTSEVTDQFVDPNELVGQDAGPAWVRRSTDRKKPSTRRRNR